MNIQAAPHTAPPTKTPAQVSRIQQWLCTTLSHSRPTRFNLKADFLKKIAAKPVFRPFDDPYYIGPRVRLRASPPPTTETMRQ
jgi:hypothetical protein